MVPACALPSTEHRRIHPSIGMPDSWNPSKSKAIPIDHCVGMDAQRQQHRDACRLWSELSPLRSSLPSNVLSPKQTHKAIDNQNHLGSNMQMHGQPFASTFIVGKIKFRRCNRLLDQLLAMWVRTRPSLVQLIQGFQAQGKGFLASLGWRLAMQQRHGI